MLSLVFILLAVVMANGLGVFWPASVAEVTLADGAKILGQRIRSEVNPDTGEAEHPIQDGQSRARPAAAGLPLGQG